MYVTNKTILSSIFKISGLCMIIFSISACSTTKVIYESELSNSDMATIIIERETQFFGGGVDVYILDEGLNKEPNSLVAVYMLCREGETTLNNKGWRRGVFQYYYYPDKTSNAVIVVDEPIRNMTLKETKGSGTHLGCNRSEI